MATSQNEALSVSQLLERDPNDLCTWVQEAQEGRKSVPDDFNWLGLAECAGQNAQKSDAADLVWARIAVAVYEALANEHPDSSFLLSAMFIRARMIGLLGPRARDAVLDPDTIRDWFSKDLSFGADEAVARSEAAWKSRNVDELRTLRRIKNKIAVIEHLRSGKRTPALDEYTGWLAVQDKLP